MIDFVQTKQKVRVMVAGRGFGKTTGIAWILFEMIKSMPRGRFFLASTTLEQIREELLPVVMEKWTEFGLKENVHYQVGGEPPEWYKTPLKTTQKFDNAISFWNGCIIMLRTNAAGRSRSKRGGNYDGGVLDEAAFINGKEFKNVYVPMLRGNSNLYKWTTHWHRSLCIFTSRPRTSKGYWIYELKKQAEEHPDDVFWIEGSAFDNVAILGKEWFHEQKIKLGDHDYQIEIENRELKQLPTGFYHNFSRDKHCYHVRKGESDIRPHELIEVSFDFGGKFNCASVWQEHNNVERCIRQFFLKEKGKITALVDKICSFYRNHELKYMRVYGDPIGHNADPGRPSLFEIIAQRIADNGWSCEICTHPGKRTAAHKSRYELMSTMLEGNIYLPQVQINEPACPDLIIALEMCDIQDDYQKNKENEKDMNFPQEHAPHFTDTVDYYLYEKHAGKLTGSSARPGGVW